MSDIEIVPQLEARGQYEYQDRVPYGTVSISDDQELTEIRGSRDGFEQFYEGAVRAVDWRGVDDSSGGFDLVADESDVEVVPAPKRAPGRPKGSKNKPKVTDSESK